MTASFLSGYPILVVDDEVEVLDGFELLLNSGGFSNVICCRDSRNVLPLLDDMGGMDVILLDLTMPYLNGRELLSILSENYPEIPVIVITATDEIETAVECIKAGAFDYLVKPVEKMRLITCVRRATERRDFARENSALKKRVLSDTLEHPEAFNAIVTRSTAMMAIFRYIEAIAGSSEPVLITGETGVGKELVARAIHSLSRRKGPFIGVNIAGLDDHSFSDTLFGHRKGAFTGADSYRDGLLKKTEGGTLFLDEIGDLPRLHRYNYCACFRKKNIFPWDPTCPRNRPPVFLRLRTGTWTQTTRRLFFGATCTTGFKPTRSSCRSCANAWKIYRFL